MQIFAGSREERGNRAISARLFHQVSHPVKSKGPNQVPMGSLYGRFKMALNGITKIISARIFDPSFYSLGRTWIDSHLERG